MLETPLVENTVSSLSGRIQKLKRRFFMGDADPDMLYMHSFSTGFQQHAGPMNEAIGDAVNARKGLMVFLYSAEHVLMANTIKILNSPDLANEIRRNFVFLPLCVTTPEGLEAANVIRFSRLPILALYKPKGRQLEDCQLYVSFAGKLDADEVVSAARTMLSMPGAVIQQQDREYEEVVQQAAERARQESERLRNELENEERTRKSIDEAFNLIPDIESGPDTISIKFLFGNGQVYVRNFMKDAPLSQIYSFARKYEYPDQFNLIYGYPPVVLNDTSASISSEISQRHAIVHVDPL